MLTSIKQVWLWEAAAYRHPANGIGPSEKSSIIGHYFSEAEARTAAKTPDDLYPLGYSDWGLTRVPALIVDGDVYLLACSTPITVRDSIAIQ